MSHTIKLSVHVSSALVFRFSRAITRCVSLINIVHSADVTKCRDLKQIGSFSPEAVKADYYYFAHWIV